MPIWDLYSKRQRRARGDAPDVYQDHDIPQGLRHQLAQIFRDSLGSTRVPWDEMVSILLKEYGTGHLTTRDSPGTPRQTIADFLLDVADTDQVLDVVELAAHGAHVVHRDGLGAAVYNASQTDKEMADEINHRFREHGVGYQIEGLQVVRVDSQLLHAEAVKPALTLLAADAYAGPNAEFLTAHERYRHGDHEEAIVACLKSFESMLKVICKRREWPHADGATAKGLLDVVFANELFPPWMQAQFAGLRAMLEAGVPTIRNKSGGHGQGAEVRETPGYLAAYAIHSTAAAILLLAGADGARSNTAASA